MQQFLDAQGAPAAVIQPKRFLTDNGDRVGFVAERDVDAGEVLLETSGSLAITAVDAAKHDVVGEVAQECEELVALALWLLAERANQEGSKWAPYLATLPATTESALLWSEAELQTLLKGSPVAEEAASRTALLRSQWQELQDRFFSKDPVKFPADVYGWQPFLEAFCVILAHCTYLPTAECFALLPYAGLLQRTTNGNGCDIDYDINRQAVTLVTTRPYRQGQEVMLNDERPNGELLLVRGEVLPDNANDCVTMTASLIDADRYFQMKQSVLEAMGMSARQAFPVYADRMPLQLLAYVRLARMQDPALFAKVSFEEDVLLNQMNEYEVLQLLMGDCRERLSGYVGNAEDEVKLLQQTDLGTRERLAAQLRLSEKLIWNSTMDGLRRKLAPIRGIPTKSGKMQDPNSDIIEIFDTIEDLPNMPKKLWNSLFGSGDQTPR